MGMSLPWLSGARRLQVCSWLDGGTPPEVGAELGKVAIGGTIGLVPYAGGGVIDDDAGERVGYAAMGGT
jgi:hypothetical protein